MKFHTFAKDICPLMKIAVYLGSKPGNDPVFAENARLIGRYLAERGVEVIYGGASVGTMKALAEGVVEAGGKLTGVFPRGFKGRVEFAEAGVDVRNLNPGKYSRYEFIETENFDVRIRTMERMSDACIILPGSTGTMHEFFSYCEGNVLGDYRKPVGILNVSGYYDPLIGLFTNMKSRKFIGEKEIDCLRVSPSPRELVDAIVDALKEQGVS